jgi:hypothetical protein
MRHPYIAFSVLMPLRVTCALAGSGARCLRYACFFILVTASLASAAEEELDERARYAQAMEIYGNPTIKIPHIDSAVKIDGLLRDDAWRQAATVEIAWQIRPIENVPAKVKTTALIMEDGDTLYVGFDAIDPDPSTIRAHLRERDTFFADDFVGVAIDTTGDSTRSFEFFANPIGVQGDALANLQNGEDFSFDAIWESAGQITDKGFEIEFAIPLSQLRFPKREGDQTWKVLFTRTWPRDKRYQAFQYPLDRDNACFMCQFQPAVGLAGAEPSKRFQVVPTVTANTHQTKDPMGVNADNRETDYEVGISDFRWGITPDITFNATVNPDYSQIEADIAQSAVNTAFVLFYPERRPFFLEGRDFFTTRMRLVNTRNISDPDYGAKITGKVGPNVYGFMTARDTVTNYLLGGSEGSRTTQEEEPHQATVFRYRRDFEGASHFGLLTTHRRSDTYDNQMVAIDGRYRITKIDTLSAQVAHSRVDNSAHLVNDFDLQPSQEDTAFQLSYSHFGRNWSWSAFHNSYGKDFRADSGFINQTDFDATAANFGYNWRGKPDGFVSSFSAQVNVGRTKTNESGELLGRSRGMFLSVLRGGPVFLDTNLWKISGSLLSV